MVLRIEDDLYPLKAVRVEDEAELRRVETRYIEKYELDGEDNFIHDAWVFRLDPRD